MIASFLILDFGAIYKQKNPLETNYISMISWSYLTCNVYPNLASDYVGSDQSNLNYCSKSDWLRFYYDCRIYKDSTICFIV
ncbi:TPA: hypothetical protein DIC40_01420 [Patescibacteria group bacterium]|nr:hypothetical protein [Candidatus Gracilibacteria bacterium]